MNNTQTIVIHPYVKRSRGSKEILLEEAIKLAQAINLNCIDSSLVGIDSINPKTYLKSGYVVFLKQKTELDRTVPPKTKNWTGLYHQKQKTCFFVCFFFTYEFVCT